MTQWWKANGGALALVVVGLTLAGFTTKYRWVLVALGLLMVFGLFVYHRLPWEVHPKQQPKRSVRTVTVSSGQPCFNFPPRDTSVDELVALFHEGEAVRESIPPNRHFTAGSEHHQAVDEWMDAVQDSLRTHHSEWALHFDKWKGHVYKLKYETDELRMIVQRRLERLSEITRVLKGTDSGRDPLRSSAPFG